MWKFTLAAVMAAVCLAAAQPSGAADDTVLYTIDFKGYPGGSVLDWLRSKHFVTKQDADNKSKIALSVRHDTLVLEAKKRALGLLLNDTGIPGVKYIRIEWEVGAFPEGVSYDQGVRSEPIMVYTFFGSDKISSGSMLVPDSPYFIGLFLCEAGRTDYPYTGRYFKEGGRYVCANTVKAGDKIITEFDIGDAVKNYFKLGDVPPVSGYAIGIDTDNAKGNATAMSYIRKIEYLN